ncbi:MAG: helix-turn-helix transcriptional regulator [Clostridia bacterium]|nr:helix-turn-helix transcriptional regulator [Clostridia bacterium]
MKNIFSTEKLHKITEANINFYRAPFVHPKRKMRDHDFIYLLQGGWKLGQNGKTYELKKDSLIILTAGNTHYGVSPCDENTKTMYFHVSCEEGDIGATADGSLGGNAVNTLIDASENKNIKKLFSEIVNSFLSGNSRKADLYFELLMCELYENSLDVSDYQTAAKIKKIIHNNPEKFFSNEELANKANVSVKTAENKFKAKFGTTIHQYILSFKIKEAVSYFDMFPEMSIKEIACNLGFYDEYHFSKQFKKLMGLSPAKYKERNAQ